MELVRHLVEHGLEEVVLGHLSGDCNCPTIASRAVRDVVDDVNVNVARQDSPTRWVEFAPSLPTVPETGGQGMLF